GDHQLRPTHQHLLVCRLPARRLHPRRRHPRLRRAAVEICQGRAVSRSTRGKKGRGQEVGREEKVAVLTIFALSSGRSGTHFLYELIRRNVRDCVARHEPYGFNPSMFGRPIYDLAVGERAYTRKLLERKRRIIKRCGATVYAETSHAFLKSWFDLAPE